MQINMMSFRATIGSEESKPLNGKFPGNLRSFVAALLRMTYENDVAYTHRIKIKTAPDLRGQFVAWGFLSGNVRPCQRYTDDHSDDERDQDQDQNTVKAEVYHFGSLYLI